MYVFIQFIKNDLYNFIKCITFIYLYLYHLYFFCFLLLLLLLLLLLFIFVVVVVVYFNVFVECNLTQPRSQWLLFM